jgi:uncharacterized protein (TIGR02594 family)
VTAFDIAQRYIGVKEFKGEKDHPLIQWWLSLCGFSTEMPDETPWCSAFMQHAPWELRLPRSKSAAARSWLTIGKPIGLAFAKPDADVVILRRGSGAGSAGAEVLHAPGHVGFFAGVEGGKVLLLGGNQGDSVSIAPFPLEAVLGVRRLT